ncbi:MAG: ATP-dependent DNA helicase RecG [Betaproteobacteria bacterium]|nr:ATP-dependent DNA helicase RecG [Betaproteobacteria bacterium]
MKPAPRSEQAARGGARVPLERKLERLGVRSREDLVLHLPLRYEDETTLTPIAQARDGRPVLVEAEVLRAEVVYRPRRQLIAHCRAQEHELTLRFFNFYPSQVKQLQSAIDNKLLLRAYGEVRGGWFGAEMAHPRYRLARAGEPLADTLTPVYPTTEGLSQAVLRRLVLEALDAASLDDTLPDTLRERYGLIGLREGVHLLHRPPPGTDLGALVERSHPAWRRVKFDELLAQQLSMRMAYRQRSAQHAPALPGAGPLLRTFRERLPFRLTGAQTRVIGELLGDLARPHPMQRLLQGDVGSGKTIVAAIACLAAVDAGSQAAVMAPTEILAEQHYRKFSAWLAPLGVRIVWLHGALKKAEKRAAIEEIASGRACISIGTHALFQEGVRFVRLALVVIDEQHRFGVAQRLSLRSKARSDGDEEPPHQLMMSATPIPRTLSMSYYADLDVSTIDELPPGRRPVTTKLVSDARRAEVIERIREACADGQQVYWVCPVIEPAQAGARLARGAARELRAALETHASLTRELPELRIGLVHGRLPAAEKTVAMEDFAAGRCQVLVATTVIEVGVDVPGATLMVIEHAERFGLAQLHQLRGRVGRGARASACILLYAAPLTPAARARLKVIYEHADGFEIARRDLLQRGPGELLGERQSGVPMLRFADLERDGELIRDAQQAAAEFLQSDPTRARSHVERWFAARHEYTSA